MLVVVPGQHIHHLRWKGHEIGKQPIFYTDVGKNLSNQTRQSTSTALDSEYCIEAAVQSVLEGHHVAVFYLRISIDLLFRSRELVVSSGVVPRSSIAYPDLLEIMDYADAQNIGSELRTLEDEGPYLSSRLQKEFWLVLKPMREFRISDVISREEGVAATKVHELPLVTA